MGEIRGRSGVRNTIRLGIEFPDVFVFDTSDGRLSPFAPVNTRGKNPRFAARSGKSCLRCRCGSPKMLNMLIALLGRYVSFWTRIRRSKTFHVGGYSLRPALAKSLCLHLDLIVDISIEFETDPS
jgi:hypothetical protein